MIDRMPPLSLADLKPGDAIVVAGPNGPDPSQVTVFTLLAGVEPILSASPVSQQVFLGAWNLDMNMGLP